jgi:hypothetical protein
VDCNWLYQHTKVVTSQHGEDGITQKIFSSVLPPNINTPWCVEVGAWDGNYLSNTWNLIKNLGWFSVQIEADLDRFIVLQKNYENDPVFCVHGKMLNPELMVWAIDGDLSDVLRKHPVPVDFDFLSIDIDSYDYQVWDSLRGFRPKVVCIEFCQAFKKGEEFIHGQDQIHTGSSLASLALLGKKKGYELVCVIGVNAFFVLKKYYHLFEINDNDVKNYEQYISEGDK